MGTNNKSGLASNSRASCSANICRRCPSTRSATVLYDDAQMVDEHAVDCSIFINSDCCCSSCFFRRFFFGMIGIEGGSSEMLVETGQDVVLATDDDDEGESGERGEPALLPFSQLVLEDINVDDGRFDNGPIVGLVLLGDRILGVVEDGNCF
jgi:hypothetical protein